MSDRPQNLDRPNWASQRQRPLPRGAWADTPRPSGIHCDGCGRVFAAGAVPEGIPKICRDCRDEMDANAHPELF